MINCKICGNSLYQSINFKNMFKMNYEVHDTCLNNLTFNYEEEAIPIQSNMIILDYAFERINLDYDEDYLWQSFFGKVLLRQIKSKRWSMIIILDEMVDNFIHKHNPYLLFNLSFIPILMISLTKKRNDFFDGI